MNFKENIELLVKELEKSDENLLIIKEKSFKFSDALKFICEEIENKIGDKTNNNIDFYGFLYHQGTPMVKNHTDNEDLRLSTKVSCQIIYLSDLYAGDPYFWVFQMSHELVHIFLSLKDNKLESANDNPTVLEEGLASYMSSLIYNKFFKLMSLGEYPNIVNNDYAYDKAEQIFKELLLLNNNDISFVKKIRKNNPSFKKLNKKDFNNVLYSEKLLEECLDDFQLKFNRVPGTY